MNEWEKCVAFHGHSCGGLAIGYRAAMYARELMKVEVSDDEQIVCIAENDACSVDAIQAVLGCTIGKGNLLFHLTGKQAYSFYNRSDGTAFRLVQKPKPAGMTREESFAYYHSCSNEVLFDVKEVRQALPTAAKIFDSYECECCGEKTGANWIRLGQGGVKLCVDCYETYDRFHA